MLFRPTGIAAVRFQETIDRHYAERGLTLPEMELLSTDNLSVDSKWNNYQGDKYVIQADGSRIGECVINTAVKDGRAFENFSWVDVIGARSRNGYGVAVYREAISRALEVGHDFRTDPLEGLTHGAIQMWQRFVDLGLAIEESELIEAWVGHDAQWDVVISHERLA